MPATDRLTRIATIVYCAVNTASSIARMRRRRTLTAGGGEVSGVFAFNRAHTIVMLGQKLIEARPEFPVGPSSRAASVPRPAE